jgi:hypothetical protein
MMIHKSGLESRYEIIIKVLFIQIIYDGSILKHTVIIAIRALMRRDFNLVFITF